MSGRRQGSAVCHGIRVTDGFLIVTVYAAAVCGPLLMSGYRNVVIGAAIMVHCRFAGPGPHRAGTGLAG
jgi:hypothetical protein